MPGLPLSGPTPSPSRLARVQTLLTLSETSLSLAASAPPLNTALAPFRRPYAGAQSAYDCVAFVHCFGVNGPSPAAWQALFSCSTGLRAEELTVLVAHAVTGGDAKAEPTERRAVMSQVVLGGNDMPGILHKVCNLFDDWLISVESLHDALTGRAVDEAGRWWIAKLNEGRYVWVRGRAAEVQVDVATSFADDALGDGMSVLARRIGIAVVKEVVEESMRRITSDGLQDAVGKVRERAEMFMQVASDRAMSALIRTVMEALGMRELPRLPWE